MNYISNDVLVERLEDEIISHYHGVKPTQQDFALKCGVSVGYVNDLLNVTNDIREKKGIRELIAVANELNISVDYLLGLTDVKSATQEAMNFDYIKKFVGLNNNNLKNLHNVACEQVIDYATQVKNGNLVYDNTGLQLDYFNELLTFGFNSIGHLLKFNRALTYFKKLLFSYKNIDNDDWVFLTAFAMYGDEQTLSKAGIKELVDPLLNIRKNDFEKEIDLLMFNLSNEFTSSFNSFFSYDILKDEIIELETLIEEKKKEAIVLIKNYGLEYINRWINNNEEVLEKLQMFASQI